MVTFDPKIIQIILGSSKHTDKSFFYTFMHTFIGEGLITNNGYLLIFSLKLLNVHHWLIFRNEVEISPKSDSTVFSKKRSRSICGVLLQQLKKYSEQIER